MDDLRRRREYLKRLKSARRRIPGSLRAPALLLLLLLLLARTTAAGVVPLIYEEEEVRRSSSSSSSSALVVTSTAEDQYAQEVRTSSTSLTPGEEEEEDEEGEGSYAVRPRDASRRGEDAYHDESGAGEDRRLETNPPSEEASRALFRKRLVYAYFPAAVCLFGAVASLVSLSIEHWKLDQRDQFRRFSIATKVPVEVLCVSGPLVMVSAVIYVLLALLFCLGGLNERDSAFYISAGWSAVVLDMTLVLYTSPWTEVVNSRIDVVIHIVNAVAVISSFMALTFFPYVFFVLGAGFWAAAAATRQYQSRRVPDEPEEATAPAALTASSPKGDTTTDEDAKPSRTTHLTKLGRRNPVTGVMMPAGATATSVVHASSASSSSSESGGEEQEGGDSTS